MAVIDEQSATSERTSLAKLWYNKEFRGILTQVLIVGLVAGFAIYIVNNVSDNLARLGVASGFDFLWQPSFYDINQTLISYTSQDTHFRAYMVGLINTLIVAVVGCFLATILGFLAGVLRLSPNWLINRMVYCWIEFSRNVPILLQILLWYAIILQLPRVRDSLDLGGGFFLNNRGLFAPRPGFETGSEIVGFIFLASVIGAIAFARWAKKRQDLTGEIRPVFLICTALVTLPPILAFLALGSPVTLDFPELRGFNFQGGVALRPELVALTWALALYTAAFIAEVVRAGIQSVSHGQTEAAYALGLRPNRTMRLIVIPQAMRVIVPPLTSQYLNLTKNSSLAIAIGYMDVVATIGGITLNQTGQAIECIAITMATYLMFSLIISAFMNWYNQRVALKER